MRDFTLSHAKPAMAAVPEGLSASTRRQYAILVSRVLSMACWPLELIDRNPLPKGFAPRTGPRPAFTYLRPDEDAKLLACTDVPFSTRLFYGFLAREGCRLGEARRLLWRHADLKHRTVRLERTKTGDVRAWAIRDDVARVLKALGEGKDPDAHVFDVPDKSAEKVPGAPEGGQGRPHRALRE